MPSPCHTTPASGLYRWLVRVATLGLLAGLIVGCGPSAEGRKSPATPARHEHVAPHGGTAVELGKEEFHLELVLDATAGRLTGYVLDGELESFVRIPAPSLRLNVRLNGVDQPLDLIAVANPATGEKVGDTSQFEAAAAWLKSTPRFDARLVEITVRGKTFRDLSFNFPKGNE